MSVEEAIQRTNDTVAAKDRLISELQEQLEQRSESDQNSNSEAAAQREAVDNDEVIREERDRLKQLQSDWEEKLLQA